MSGDFQCNTGARSLFYISKLAQSHRLKLNVVPTVLVGFKNQSRLMWNDPQSGCIKVKANNLQPEHAKKFILENFHVFYHPIPFVDIDKDNVDRYEGK